jgi:hypothetical protein
LKGYSGEQILSNRADRIRQLEKGQQQILTKIEEIFPFATSDDITALERKARKDENEELLKLLKDLKAAQEELRVLRGF